MCNKLREKDTGPTRTNSGSVTPKKTPYIPIVMSLEVWGRVRPVEVGRFTPMLFCNAYLL